MYVTTLDLTLAERLLRDLISKGFEISTPPHTRFSGKKKGISCTLYNSGKLVVQGKEIQEFVEFYLEPELLQTFTFAQKTTKTAPISNIDPTPRIGIDESGKGDFFGPLCVAGVYAHGDEVAELVKIGVQDSKKLTDDTVMKLARKIREKFAHHIVRINPERYNDLYEQFRNLNRMLAWGHATTIEQLVLKTQCTNVIVDQFAAEHVVEIALGRKKLAVELHQQHRAEADPVVAAASILARDAFLFGLRTLGQQIEMTLPKGASAAVIKTGKNLVQKLGREALRKFSKVHFQTTQKVLAG